MFTCGFLGVLAKEEEGKEEVGHSLTLFLRPHFNTNQIPSLHIPSSTLRAGPLTYAFWGDTVPSIVLTLWDSLSSFSKREEREEKRG